MKRLAILILTATVSVPGLACSSREPTYFEDLAPGARNLLVFRIESLELEPGPDELELHRIKGKVRILKNPPRAAKNHSRLPKNSGQL